MLTYPSDPLTQIVCPMDEVALPQSHYHSAPPHSEPSAPLPLFSSITPSSANNGISGRIPAEPPKKQSTDAAEKLPAQIPSLSKRQREGGRMVQASEAKQPRIDGAHEGSIKDGFDAGLPEESQNQLKNSQNQVETSIAPAENVAQNLDGTESDMDTCGELVEECVSSSNKWVIGPMFQSLKSKISSFTEIVMTPVKVFRANGAQPSTVNLHHDDKAQAFGTSNMEQPNLNHLFDPQAGGESVSKEIDVIGGAHKAQALHKCCKKLNMDLSAQNSAAGECPTTETEKTQPDFVPLEHNSSACIDSVEVLQSTESIFTSIPLCPSVSASQESQLKVPSAKEELKGNPASQVKPLLRKAAGNRKRVNYKTSVSDLKKVTEKESDPETTAQLPATNTLDSDKDHPSYEETVLSEFDRKTENGLLVRESLQSYLSEGMNGRILRSSTDYQAPEAPLITEARPAAGHRRPKGDLKWGARSQNTVKRKRVPAYECHQRATRTRQAASAGGNKKGKHDGEMLRTIKEAVDTKTESFEAVHSLNNNSGASEENVKGSNSRVKPKNTRRPRTQTCPSTADMRGDDDMDLETTIAIQSTKQTHPEQLPDVLCHPEELQSTRENTRNPPKRKSPTHSAFSADSENTVNTLPEELLEEQTTDLNAFGSFLQGHGSKLEVEELFKKPKKTLRSKPEGSHEMKNINVKTKENGSHGSESNVCVIPLYSDPDSLELGQDVTLAEDEGAKGPDSASGEPLSATRSSTSVFSRHPKTFRPRKDAQRRKCRVLPSRKNKVDEFASCISQDDSNLATAGTRTSKTELSRRLLRSYSCPEMSMLRSSDIPWNSTHSPHHSRIQPSHQHARTGPSFPHHAHRSAHRARRHTVCSVEVEREIAPLCLRKEVYPSRRPAPYDTSGQSPSSSLTPCFSTSLSSLASCFLSSPLAFLSKKADGRGASAGPSAPSQVSSPASLFKPLSSASKHLSGFIKQPDGAGGIMNPSGMTAQCETGGRQRCEADDDGENTSSSSQEFEDLGLREEKAFSDSEVKVSHKNEERGKVSSIRIRKALPKPQNNLTPMGLPKAVRLKKKDFSLEEIYTNKNFNKPRESRLETIFEVPTSRKNGSVSSFGQKRIRRFLEFQEVGEARKPKKPLVGGGKAGIPSSRTRRGGFPKEAPPLTVQDVDSLLCAKLDQLNLWLIHDQSDG